MIFQLTPDTEAPAEMHMFYPGLRALNLAENATHNLHNIYPDPRRPGARCQRLGQVPQRGARPVRAESRRGVRPASLAGVGQRARVLDYLAKQRDPTSTCTTRRCGS